MLQVQILCMSLLRCPLHAAMNAGGPNAFVVKAQCEPRGLGLNTAEPVKVEDTVARLEESIDQEEGLPVSF